MANSIDFKVKTLMTYGRCTARNMKEFDKIAQAMSKKGYEVVAFSSESGYSVRLITKGGGFHQPR